MRLENIKYCFTNGAKGLNNCSNLEKSMVTMQQEHPELYQKILQEAKEIYEIPSEKSSLDNDLIISEEKKQTSGFTPVDRLGLSTKTINCLKVFRINDLKELLKINLEEFRKQRNVDKTAIEEVETFIKKYIAQKEATNNNRTNNKNNYPIFLSIEQTGLLSQRTLKGCLQ